MCDFLQPHQAGNCPILAKPQRHTIDTYVYIKVVSYRCQGIACIELPQGVLNMPSIRNLWPGSTLIALHVSTLVAGKCSPIAGFDISITWEGGHFG